MNEQSIYIEIWNYLTELFNCPVIQGLQNNSPLPENCIVMTLLPYTQDLDQSQYINENGESTIQTSKLYMIQLDFYGEQAFDRVTQCATIWRSQYTTSKLQAIQPLYANNPRNMPFVNEQDQYEKRFLLEIALQYNPYYTYAEQSDTVVSVDITLANQ
nr:MAG TPA: tail completion protein [Caudoviricetes sp.]